MYKYAVKIGINSKIE